MKIECSKDFANGSVFLMRTEDGFPIETTDTFLPYYTKDAIGNNQNSLSSYQLGDRSERWMVGVSTMSGCPVKCKFCATAQLKKWRNLTAEEMVQQVEYVVSINSQNPAEAKEFKINWTRMGEPFLNVDAVKEAIDVISSRWPNVHHYVSTIGLKGSDFSWIKGNVTLQFSIHSFDETFRNWLIPVTKKMTLEEIGHVETQSSLKTTLNLTLVNESDFDIDSLKTHFDPAKFFIKLSPINKNDVAALNGVNEGIIQQTNLI